VNFVPVFVPPPPSRRARQLASELESTITAFRSQNPRLRDAEVHQALGLARQRATSTRAAKLVIVGAILAAVLLLGVLFYTRQTTGDSTAVGESIQSMTPHIAIIIVLLLVLFVVKMKR